MEDNLKNIYSEQWTIKITSPIWKRNKNFVKNSQEHNN